MSDINFRLFPDQYLIIEKDSNSFLVYTKCTSTDYLTFGLSSGIQVWISHLYARSLEELAKMNEMETAQQCFSYLLSSLISKNVALTEGDDGKILGNIVHLEFGPLKVSLKLALEVSNSATEIKRLLFALVERSTKLEEEANKREKEANNIAHPHSSPNAMPLYPAPSK